MKKGLCPLLVQFLVNVYTNQVVRVKWNRYKTSAFKIWNGVKQGGVLSPVLFTLYIDELLIRLKQSGLGCYIGHTFDGAFGYADDVNLLSPTRKSMNLMLRIAWQYGIDHDVIFNPTKSKLVVFGNYGKIDGSVIFGQTVLAASTESCEMHLGNELGPSMPKEY